MKSLNFILSKKFIAKRKKKQEILIAYNAKKINFKKPKHLVFITCTG